ncbi:Major facilitator superfamily domain general substrate transporter [Penicillium brevicompactum]|uniref:Major facilitator superfamily domain general substrate transporter n=1 Tax=Penicillium brevicompactum TaxID=5074 RepID=A0A9W9UHB6_PENBR|nr:Major facilitator superfamily domain general substrate transporter [Penicillium brevicompactum]
MGRHSTTSEIFDNESKIDFGVPNKTVQNVTSHPAGLGLGSSVQLFDNEATIVEEQRIFGIQQTLVFICIIILTVMDSLNATILMPGISHLANTFDTSLASTFWATTTYLLFGAASHLYFAMLSEVFGHGPIWIIAALLATIGTGVCCGSLSLAELMVGRMIQGIGGGGAMSLCFVAMRESAPEAIHSRYSCYILLMRMAGAILGLVAGGLFIDHGNWTWAFYFNFVFCALGLLGIPFAVDLRVSKNIPLRKLRMLDWAGVTMPIFGFGGVLVGLSWGGTSYQWSEWQTAVPLTVGSVVLLILVFYESKWASHPQFGRKVFRSKMMTMTYLGCFLHGLVALCHIQFFTLYFISTHYMSATLSGMALLALIGLAIGPVAIVGVILAKEVECTQWIISGGWTLTTLASGCSILLDNDTPTIAWVLLLFTAGLGHGLLLSSYNVRVQNAPVDEDALLSTYPTTMSFYARAWGWAFAIPVGGAVFLNILGDGLLDVAESRALVSSANGFIILMKDVNLDDQQREVITAVSVAAFRALWEVITGISVLGGISSAFLWRNN